MTCERSFDRTPLVDLGVGLILFEAGLRLRWSEVRGGAHSVVLGLISLGVLITLAGSPSPRS